MALIPLLLTLHNVEEALLLPRALPMLCERLPLVLQTVVPRVTYSQFLVVLLVVTVVPYLIAAAGKLERTGSPAVYLLLLVQAVLLLNVLSHVGTAIVLGGYSPGLVTALVVNLPFSLYLLRRASRERWVSRRALLWLAPLALLVHGPGLLGLMCAAGHITGST